MTKYELVKDELFKKLNYYSEKAIECKDLIEYFNMVGWFTVETCEVLSKSDLQYSDKKELVFLMLVYGEKYVLYEFYKLNTKKVIGGVINK